MPLALFLPTAAAAAAAGTVYTSPAYTCPSACQVRVQEQGVWDPGDVQCEAVEYCSPSTYDKIYPDLVSCKAVCTPPPTPVPTPGPTPPPEPPAPCPPPPPLPSGCSGCAEEGECRKDPSCGWGGGSCQKKRDAGPAPSAAPPAPLPPLDPMQLDLRRFAAKLARDHATYFSDATAAEAAVAEYRRFLRLHQLLPPHRVAASKVVDLVWYEHVIDTKTYFADSERLFGAYLHRDPSAAVGAAAPGPHGGFAGMWEAYEREFGSAPPAAVWGAASAPGFGDAAVSDVGATPQPTQTGFYVCERGNSLWGIRTHCEPAEYCASKSYYSTYPNLTSCKAVCYDPPTPQPPPGPPPPPAPCPAPVPLPSGCSGCVAEAECRKDPTCAWEGGSCEKRDAAGRGGAAEPPRRAMAAALDPLDPEGLDLRRVAERALRDPDNAAHFPDAGAVGRAVAEYRRFLRMHQLLPEHRVAASKLVDLVWHEHVGDTAAYIADTDRLFGRYLHHYPCFVDEPGRSFDHDASMRDAYAAAFGGAPPIEAWGPAAAREPAAAPRPGASPGECATAFPTECRTDPACEWDGSCQKRGRAPARGESVGAN